MFELHREWCTVANAVQTLSLFANHYTELYGNQSKSYSIFLIFSPFVHSVLLYYYYYLALCGFHRSSVWFVFILFVRSVYYFLHLCASVMCQ